MSNIEYCDIQYAAGRTIRLILECSKINSQPQNKRLFPTLWNEHRASSNSKTLILGYIGPNS